MNSCGKGMDSFLASNGSPNCKKYLSILEADANVVLTRQNCRVNTVGNSSMTIYNKHVLERARHESEGAGALQYEIVKEIIYYE
ncbi:hypothetical protein DW172_02725 [Agathobacter rectalis]|jgi:hypothetical protein|uniref:Uncharacterized protein n=1 Tax=Agathobacter rectalis TaxID=39491 RepID=A0A3E4M0R7_9FIRM|nr:hypothetical protein DXD13_06725 [Agathobacter rectalis]RGM73220.1 hypothetical protein DXB99_03635 [Agathobacter rectalis]RHI25618.1 hypothetical protein DW172_02725 [Agathobacter rectalis]RHL31284.1 hypothetical protein DW028_02425 [Agathobacter rectalis]